MTMTHSLASARALLAAKSFPAARRAVGELLKERPDDAALLSFAVEIEQEAGEYKTALELARAALKTSPDNSVLRAHEIDALYRLGRKAEMSGAVGRFEKDFPWARGQIDLMKIQLDSMHGRTQRLKSMLDGWSADTDQSPEELRNLGIGYYKIGELYRAQRMMLEAHRAFPDDFELNEALATSSYLLVRPATARKYATLALAARPDHGQLRFLKAATYLLYWPPFFVMAHCMSLALLGLPFLGKYGALAVVLLLMFLFGDLINIWWHALSVVLQRPTFLLGSLAGTLLYGLTWFAVTDERFYKRLFGRKKELKVRRY
jgi:tetratricopeptide (TPR) repeat protein